MKYLVRLGLLSNLLLSSSVFALNPIQGFYIGFLGEVSHGPSQDTIYFRDLHLNTISTPGKIDFSPISGGAGAMLGYKLGHLRLEAEILYNAISTGPLTFDNCTLQSPEIYSPSFSCPSFVNDNYLAFDGTRAAFFGFANIFWDFFSWDGETYLVPYLGAGIGKAQIKNSNNFVNSLTGFSVEQTSTGSGNAFQGIAGISYFIDDYTTIAMDFRHVTTQSSREYVHKNYNLETLNFSVNFAFDKGGIDWNG